MKFSFSEIMLFISLLFLLLLLYDTNKDLNYASETSNYTKRRAIQKQQKLIDFQIYYINSFARHSASTTKLQSANMTLRDFNRVNIIQRYF